MPRTLLGSIGALALTIASIVNFLSKGFGMTAKNPLKLFQTVFGMGTSEFLQFSFCALCPPFCTEDLPGKDSRFALVG